MRDFHFPGRSAVRARNGMAATSHPLASLSAIEALRQGGNAVDAAIAASAVLAVVEPQSTGIGGDCFALYCPGGSSEVIGFNGSGRSPEALTTDRLETLGATEIAVDSVHSVTLPGAIDAWTRLNADHGRLELARLLRPAIEYARHGYPVTARVRHDWLEAAALLRAREDSRAIFLPNDRVPAEGDIHHQPRLADSLAAIASQGARGFYEGPVAEAMTATLKRHGGLHRIEDFAAVCGEYVEPVSTNYRGFDIHQVPPNTQGVTALVMLNILEGYALAELDPLSAERLHLEIEAGRIAFDMRNRYLADPQSMKLPLERLLSKAWSRQLRSKLSRDRAMSGVGDLGLTKADTVYVCVVDRDLNAISFINSLFDSFGSGILCPTTGVMFQNRGTSFTLDPDHPNCIAPGKRPMHTIMPGMMTRGERAEMPFGVMGGDYQPFGHCHVVSNILDHGLDVQEAMDVPRVFPLGEAVEIERSVPPETSKGLCERGHKLRLVATPHGGGQAIRIDRERGLLTGGSDPRKDGCALGF